MPKATIAEQNASFEDWWSKKSHMLKPSQKAMYMIAFKDGWYSADKHREQG